MAHDSPPCPSCGASVEPDTVCLACLFDEALEAEDSHFVESPLNSFGDYAPPTAGVFGKYILRRMIGEGGMGVIWEAEDTTLQRVVALKMIRGFAFSTDGEKQRFRAEASAVAQLDHPNIVPIYEIGEIDGKPYFTMKLLRGGSLSDRLRDGALEERDAAEIMEKLARAIHHAHERGVLHRDLKPDNVLFDEVGETYLTDFGLAKLLDSSTGLTRTHAHIGTPQYMSPEQARGRADDITAASDVWGAGALFYHMLSGRVPFPGASSGEIFDHVANEDPLPLERSSGGQVDEPLETLCLHCLQKDPTQRLPSAEFLAAELGRWLAGETIQIKPLHRRPAKGRWRRVAAVGVIGCILATAAFIAVNRDDSPGKGSTTPSQGIDLTQTSNVDHVVLDATEGSVQAGVWIEPGDIIRSHIEGSYTHGDDSRIWSLTGDEESGTPAGEEFAFPDLRPWALVGLVRSDSGETSHFLMAEEVNYSGKVAGELSFAINTPVGEAGSAGGFRVKVDATRQTKIFTAGTDPFEAWGVPMLKPADSYLGLRMTVNGEALFSEVSEILPEGGDGLLAPHLGPQKVIAKVGQAEAFALVPGFQRFGHSAPGWLHVSVNDEIARPGAYADNDGALEVSAQVYRHHRKFARPITLGKASLRPLSFDGENSKALSFFVPAKAIEQFSKGGQHPPVYLRSEPSPGLTKIEVTVIRADADTYAFMVEDFPQDSRVAPSHSNPYLAVEDAENVFVRWGGALYNRALFHRRPPLAEESGKDSAFSLEPGFKPSRDPDMPAWPEKLYLVVEPDGRLRPGAPEDTEDFNRAATWTFETEKQSPGADATRTE